MCRGAFIIILFLAARVPCHTQDTLQLTRGQCEVILLERNLILLAEKLNISKAAAQAAQARLWPNPSFTFDQLNLWAGKKQTGGVEVVPPLWNDFGRNRQFAFELEQLIQTAGKRKKLIALELVNTDKAATYFNEVLRNLKIEFRNQLTALQFLQLSQHIVEQQWQSIRRLTTAYQKQVQQGNIAKNEWVRLQAQELEIKQELNNLRLQNNQLQHSLKTLMHLEPATFLRISTEDFYKLPERTKIAPPEQLLAQAKENRPDLRMAQLEQLFNSRLYRYEKAKRIPDLALKASYDRNGSTMLNFIGFGAAIELPFFNRNQGSIQAAAVGEKQAELLAEQLDQTISNDVMRSYQALMITLDLRMQIDDSYIDTLDEMLEAYTRNFQQRNISVVTYLDFLEAYMENRKSILEAARSVRNAAEELAYAAGIEIPYP